jgi:hypothetical protein
MRAPHSSWAETALGEPDQGPPPSEPGPDPGRDAKPRAGEAVGTPSDSFLTVLLRALGAWQA